MPQSAPTASETPRALAPLGFLIQSVLCQGIALGVAMGIRAGWPTVAPLAPWGDRWSALFFVVVQALVAWRLARWVKLPTVWQLFNLVVVPGIASLAAFEIPTVPLSILAALVFCLYLPTFWTRVPYYPTSVETYARIARCLPADRPFTFVDLGCGFGPLLRYLARSAPHGKFLGVEISPLAFLGAWVRSITYRNIAIRFRSIWSVHLGDFDVAYAFLAPGPMPELWAKVEREMAPTTLFISNTFPAPVPPDEVIAIPDRRGAQLFIYHPAKRR